MNPRLTVIKVMASAPIFPQKAETASRNRWRHFVRSMTSSPEALLRVSVIRSLAGDHSNRHGGGFLDAYLGGHSSFDAMSDGRNQPGHHPDLQS